MRVLVVGCGRMGSAAAEDLSRTLSHAKVVVADKDQHTARNLAEKIGRQNVSWISVDATDQRELIDTLRDFDLALGFLPPRLGFRLMEACIQSETNLVDVSYMPENPLHLHEKALKAGITVVPHCGLAPGISNILVGHAFVELEKVEKVHVYVGGLPEKPIPPLGYVITWSPESLIEEYTSKARIVEDGKIVEVEALSGLEKVEFPKIGMLEAFYTDGLRTLLYTVQGVGEMWEKTLRYLGHAEKIRLLRDLGFFDDKEIAVNGVNLQPRKLTAKLFEKNLYKPDVKDIVVLKVDVHGYRKNGMVRLTYTLTDFYDEKSGMTAMARTTGYTASIVAKLIVEGVVRLKGVVPPERLGMDRTIYQQIMAELNSRGIKIVEETFAE
ncbi:MAG: saccharopine dehydrogenase family protein [Candidatus Bathyarchaeia archaeon]